VVVRRMWRDRGGLRDRAHGGWELASVATSGLAIVMADLGIVFVAVLFWTVAIAVYVVMTGLIVWRAVHDRGARELMQPDLWILMGGAAIATLAGDHLDEAGLTSVWPVTVVTWVVATAWNPAAGVRLHSAPHRPGVASGVPARDVFVGHVCHGRRNWLAMADCRVAGVLVDRVRGMDAHRDPVARRISAITRCGYSVRSNHVKRSTCQPSSASLFCRSRST
jgi:hypothetical protein